MKSYTITVNGNVYDVTVEETGATPSAPVKAAAAGTVTAAGLNGGYGRFISIDHGSGMSTAYGHMSALAVTVGQQVSRGQVIGYVGSSGYSTGPHLHFEVRENGQTENPLQFAVPPRTRS